MPVRVGSLSGYKILIINPHTQGATANRCLTKMDAIIEKKMFKLGADLKLHELKKNNALPVYSRVFYNGYGHDCTPFAVIAEPDSNGMQKIVSVSNYFDEFNSVDFMYCSPISKLFGIGIYWDDIDPDFRFSESDVLAAIERAKIQEQKTANEQAEKEKADREELEKLPKLYPHLEINHQDDKNVVKKNIVADLKKNFPGFKFSVRKRGYNSYDISWTDGPAPNEVDKIVSKFDAYSFDVTGDFLDYDPDNFNRVFGGVKFLNTSREKSEKLTGLMADFMAVCNIDGMCNYEKERIFYRVLSGTSFPLQFENAHFETVPNHCGSIEEYYRIVFDVVEPEQVRAQKSETIKNNTDLQIVDYSEKAFAITGDTKPVKDILKDHGGRFNFNLSCGPGWIFSKTKLDELKKALNL